MNDRLRDCWKTFGNRPALVWRGQAWTYRDLVQGSRDLDKMLDDLGIEPRLRVAFSADFTPQAVMLLASLSARRNTVVPLAPALSDIARLLEIARADVYLGEGRVDWCARSEATHPLLLNLRRRAHAGLILFSSGSTGEPKASLLDLDRWLEKFGDGKPRTTLAFLKLDHIGGLNTLFHTLASGGTLVTLDSRDPDSVCAAIARHQVELLPTTPTFLNMLLIDGAHLRRDLSSLRLITYGTEPMPASTLNELHRALPHVVLKQTYGLTELGIMPTQSRSADSLFMRVGGPGCETKIEGGTLRIRADSAMLGYLNAPSPFDADGWFDTGDAVEIEGDCIRVLGRASELINVGGEKVYPTEVENVLLRAGNVREARVSGKRNAITGQIVVATITLVEPEDPEKVETRVRDHCRQHLVPHQMPVLIHISDETLCGDRFKMRREAA